MSFNGWKIVKLEEVVDVLGDGLHGTPLYDSDGEYYFINGNNLNGKISLNRDTKRVNYEEFLKYRKNLNDRTVLVSINGTLGNVAIYNGEKVVLGKSACYFNVKEDVEKHYIKYVMQNNKFKEYIQSHSTGTTIKNMGLKSMREYSFELPSILEQKSIAHILSTLDEKIEVNNRINKTLENMAQTIFKQWFVDFEFPNENGEPYKSSGGEMVESELGMIPKGWEVERISSLFNVKDGTHDSPKAVFKGHYLITSKHLMGTCIDFKSANMISDEDYIEVNKRSKVNRYDILISMIGTVGNLYLVQDKDICFTIKNVGLFKTSEALNLYEYIYCYFKSPLVTQYIIDRMAGSTQQYISLGELRKIPVAMPREIALINIKRFKTITQPIFDEIYSLATENKKLEEIRDSLLPKLMSGEIRVPIDEN